MPPLFEKGDLVIEKDRHQAQPDRFRVAARMVFSW